MIRAPRSLLALAVLLSVGACSSFDFRTLGIPGVYRATIQQGNVITQEMIDRLKPGMTQRQVRFILGEPILGNTFREDRWDYVYTQQVGARDRIQQRLTLWFEDDALDRFEGDFLPTAVKEAREAAQAAAEAGADAG